MEPGIFETTFARSTLGERLDAVAALGVGWVQLDLASAGLPSLPTEMPDELAADIRRETRKRGILLAAVSGTYNMVHPDPRVRAQGMAALRAIASASRRMGGSVITLCTGTRDPDNMWRWHPANGTPEAWRDLLEAMTGALVFADEFDVLLAFEPEPANVVANAALGRTLLRELDHPRLKVVLDPANILASNRERPPAAVLEEAFALLGEQIAVAHAKDLDADGRFCAAGRGIVPWDLCLRLFRGVGFAGPLVLHSLPESDAARAVRFLRQTIADTADR
jgi:sugar phosphate isomerase/epimerase